MKYGIVLTILYLLTAAQVSAATEWYAGPDGKAENPGTKETPWDIASALDGVQRIAAGDTIFLLDGTYKRRPAELIEVRLAGTEENPIHVRALPGK